MKLINNKQDCCGCTACKNICPKNAITMVEDKQGYLYPKIDDDKCINCHLCRKVCAFNDKNIEQKKMNLPKVYAAKNKISSIRLTSSSGGVFVAVSDYILQKNGVIYGVKFDRNLNVYHERATTQAERDDFKGSKYIQSDLREIFLKVKEDIEREKFVLFTGTPCQIAGLKNFLGGKKDTSKLYLCDIVCHGVPSQKIFNEYKDFMQRKYKSNIKSINFRSKRIHKQIQDIRIVFDNKEEFNEIAVNDVFYRLFLDDIILRPSCYNCKFTSIYRQSDITLADYWGIEKSIPEFQDYKGISLVLVNTLKGKDVFGKISDKLIVKESNISACMQPNLKSPCSKSYKVDLFWKDYYSKGFKYVAKKYGYYGRMGNIRRELHRIFRGIKRRIKSNFNRKLLN
jgi:coenzyme F420-reducing hydrogenase beta subunit